MKLNTGYRLQDCRGEYVGTVIYTDDSSILVEYKNGGSITLDYSDFRHLGWSVCDAVKESVDHPTHYNQGSIEVIDMIRASLTPEEFDGFCKGNILKYTMRERYKGGTQDLEKAKKYMEWLIERKPTPDS